MYRGRSRIALLVLTALPVLAVVGQEPTTQETEETPLGVFSEVLDVRVVNVEVVVTDKQGLRVRGLGSQDFRLLVDGGEVPIEYFSEISGGTVTMADSGGDPDPDAAPEVRLPGALEPGQEVGTSFLVFVDDQFLIARDRNRVLKRFEEDLGRLGSDDRIAMVAFDGRQLELLTSWTSSPRVLEDAFRTARDRKAFGLQRMSELRRNDDDRRDRQSLRREQDAFVTRAGGTPSDDLATWRLDPAELNYAQRLEEQVNRSVAASVASLRSFAQPPGRKVMLILSGGWPFSLAEYTVGSYDGSLEELSYAGADPLVPKGREIYGDLSDTANLLGYTLYPVDVPGMNRGFGALDASVAAPNPRSGSGAPAVGGGLYPREHQQHDSLLFLARETGGEALINSQRDVAFTRVVEDTRSYYWLGFSPDRREDDASHSIEVEVLRKGLDVRSRRGFLDFSREAESTMMVESALFFGDPPTSVPLDLRFGRPQRVGRGKVDIPIEVGIPMDHVTMLPVGGRLRSELEVRVTVMDERGARSDTPMDKIVIEGDGPPAPGQMFRYQTSLTMRTRKHRLIVAVTDPVTGTMMSSSGEVDP